MIMTTKLEEAILNEALRYSREHYDKYDKYPSCDATFKKAISGIRRVLKDNKQSLTDKDYNLNKIMAMYIDRMQHDFQSI